MFFDCLWQVNRDNKAEQHSFPAKTRHWTRCSIIVERKLTEINLRHANGRSPPLKSALIDWHGVLSSTEQSWNNYSNLHVEWWSSMWSGAEVSGTQHWSGCHDKGSWKSKARCGEVYDGIPTFHGGLAVLIEKTEMFALIKYLVYSEKIWRSGACINWQSTKTHIFLLSNSKLKWLHSERVHPCEVNFTQKGKLSV